MKKSLSFLSLLTLALFLSACSGSDSPAEEVEDVAQGGVVLEELPVVDEDTLQNGLELTPGKWELLTNESMLTWYASRIASDEHSGSVGIQEGFLNVDAQENVTGEFVVDMNAITESKNNETFLEQVRSNDFFGIYTFPEARFVITDVQELRPATEGTTFTVTGDLTIKDVTSPISFETTAVRNDSDKIFMISTFEIDRNTWGVSFESGIEAFGDQAIKDMIRFDLQLVFRFAEPLIEAVEEELLEDEEVVEGEAVEVVEEVVEAPAAETPAAVETPTPVVEAAPTETPAEVPAEIPVETPEEAVEPEAEAEPEAVESEITEVPADGEVPVEEGIEE